MVNNHAIGYGVDGCRRGWLLVSFREGEVIANLYPTITALSKAVPSDSPVWVDMPIGFSISGPEGRSCDRLARRILSPRRHSSIFTPPCRAALYADLAEASTVNYKHTGKKLSRQSINIIPKIRELDVFLQTLSKVEQQHWLEAHPEVVFAAFNRGPAVPASKKTAEGQAQRLALLAHYFPEAEAWVNQQVARYLRKQLLPDDMIDALGLAMSAYLWQKGMGELVRLPAVPELDETGLQQQLVYLSL